jgi:hypothetical protein
MDNKRENITERELVLQDIELCKKLAPIMERKGIERDWAFDWEDLGSVEYPEGYYLVHPDEYNEYEDYDSPTWRLDKLLSALPHWCVCLHDFEHLCMKFDDLDFVRQIQELYFLTINEDYNRRIEGWARLLILLEENNLND